MVTYRLQFSKDQTFQTGAELVPYLEQLGIATLYSSPLLESGAGSNHGYDVVNPGWISVERGGIEGLDHLLRTLREAGMTMLIDIVPNHVGVEVPKANPWWWDVLTHGQASRWAGHFDIDWAAGPILLPILDADEAGALAQLTVQDGELRYYEHAFPLAPGTGSGTPQEVHERQHYRLVSWKRGAAELTYRRFFDVSTLAAVRVEIPEVFEDAHREVLRWVRAHPEIVGLRVDHPDGLSDPGAYVRRLRAALGPDKWLLVEKITHLGEELPASWPVDGTSGYEALADVQGVFVDPDGAGLLTQFAAEHTGVKQSIREAEYDGRREVADTILAAEVRRIAALVPGESPDTVRDAVAEFLCGFPVYRSYLPEGRDSLDTALSVARTRRPDLKVELDTIYSAMLAEPHGELATRVQQTSGMVMAKGVEDTAFYRWNRFVALNEVGGDPGRFGLSPAGFHAALAAREAGSPRTMTTLSTHDTKRSEDVRARLAVLAEIPGEWTARLRDWSARYPLPDRSLELLAWQCLVGAWPISAERLASYLGKASKEAKLVTSHVDAVPEVDEAIAAWPAQVLGDAALVAEIQAFVDRIAGPGWSNSLGQKLLQLAGPGIPDVYQGTEVFEYSLVDPDNRRPVDFAARRALLSRLDEGWLPEIDSGGAAKLLVTATAARLRRFRPELFQHYRAVPADGVAAEHAVAFARTDRLVAVATRLPVGLAAKGGWGDTVLPLPGGADDWHDMITDTPVDGATPALGTLLSRYPVALLVRPA
ncbi:malto-oligosyltrehalose synthase [Pseudonocardia oroxyli]|uniref:Maltooligosyl trehalose synthase n=1 Tax=Pseudonocardia oroxyli TaxID=366584 RepID=A0A1G7ED38_PSEOR|nr:malto-oligosyltrehalose synthase [Pseudonocardia oroxyli]SDE61542.1 maltooligosyl trehalose synthase [Pseudonocardia oroxyli]